MWLLLVSFLQVDARAAPADCAEPARAASLMATVNVAEAAFAASDRSGFIDASLRAEKLLHCMEEVFEPGDAAAVHRFEALKRYFDKDMAGADAALRGWLATNREAELSLAVAPEGHPLRSLFDAATKVAPASSVELVLPPGRSLGVDGRLTQRAVSGRPYVAQLLDEKGLVLWTGYESDPATPPDWTSLAGAPPPAPVVVEKPRNKKLSRGIIAGATAVSAGGLYTAARLMHNKALSMESPVYAEDPAQIDAYVADYSAAQRKANSLSIAAAGLGIISVGFGVSVAF